MFTIPTYREGNLGDGEVKTMLTIVEPLLLFQAKLTPKVADPFPTATPFPQLWPTYFRASQYQSILSDDMSQSKSNLAYVNANVDN